MNPETDPIIYLYPPFAGRVNKMDIRLINIVIEMLKQLKKPVTVEELYKALGDSVHYYDKAQHILLLVQIEEFTEMMKVLRI